MMMAEKMGLRKARLINDIDRLTGHIGFIETKWLFAELSTPPDKPPAETRTAAQGGLLNGGDNVKAGAFENGIYGNNLLTASAGGAA